MVTKLVATCKSAIANFKTDSFYRHALLFMAASLITSVLNYAYYPIMGRMIGVEGYGELQVVTSFLLQLTTVFIGLNLISVNIVANHDERESKALIIALQKVVFWFVLFACLGVLLASSQLKHFFHFSSSWPFILLIPSLLVDAIAVFWTAYLQAKRDFTSLSFYTILTGGGKVIFSMLFVKLGLGVAGGILGIAAGLWLSLIAVRLITKHELPPLLQTLSWPRRHEMQLIKRHVSFIIEVIVALIGMSVLLSIDVMLVKHLFSAEFAGQYSGVSTVARIIFYASAPLVSVMLPAITLSHLKASKQAFYRTLGLSVTICVAGLLVFTLLSHVIMRVLLGEQFANASSWLPLLSIVALLVTITNVMVNYLLALRSHLALIISLASLLLATVLIFMHHGTVQQIVASTSIGLLAGQAIFWTAFFATGGNLVRGETGEGA
jgi:O-antigen/teichoic acid export membrane protein